MRTKTIIIGVLIMLLTPTATFSQHPKFSVTDSLALVALFNSTNGAGWTDHWNWLSKQSPRFWTGVRVNDDYDTRVRKLLLPNNNLKGKIPPELGNLTACEELSLYGNQLSGRVPNSIQNMSSLVKLYLQNNLLILPFPSLSTLNNLKELYLGNNAFEGIPELGSVNNLQTLNLDNSNFTGAIPQTISNLKSLISLSIKNAKIDVFPAAPLINMPNLQALYLSNNKIDILQSFIAKLRNLTILHLDGNQLTSIPEEINGMEKMFILNLKKNKITEFPKITGMPNLNTLDVSENKLSFKYIIPNINVAPLFFYHYQDKYGVALTILAEPGDVKRLKWGFTEPGNVYQWLKDNVEISGANSNEYVLEINSLEDFGSYTLKVTNPAAPNLTLFTQPMYFPPPYYQFCSITQVDDKNKSAQGLQVGDPNNIQNEFTIRVMEVNGEVELLRKNKIPVELRGGEVLVVSDRIYTGMESTVTLAFADCSTVVVQELTDVTINSFKFFGNAVQTQIFLKAGEVDAAVVEESAVKSDFKVRTPTATCSVRGTKFSVKHDSIANVTTTLVAKGKVNVAPENNPADSVMLNSWQKVAVSETGFGNVTSFALNKIEIRPDTVEVNAGLKKLFSAIGYDTEGNSTSVEVNWEVEQGAIDSIGLFTAGQRNGYYTITATDPVHNLEATAVVRIKNGWPVGSNDLPLTGFELEPNYPNPFEKNTTINFTLPVMKHVILKIYNVLGDEVKTVLNENREKGKHAVQLSANDFESGVYFYQLQAGAFVETKRMMLLK